MSNLLLDEQPLLIMPKLATKIGLNEAIVLQQIHYWIQNKNSGVIINGHKWVYNSINQWAEQFPFWSTATIKRTLSSLRENGYLIAEKLSDDGRDNTLYYRINYTTISEPCIGSNCTNAMGQNDQITIYTETTTDIPPIPPRGDDEEVSFSKIVDLYHECLDSLPTVRMLTSARRKALRSRIREDAKRKDPEWWRGYFEYAASIPFLAGKGESDWKPNFDWLINETNMVKVIEGKYQND